MQVVDARVDDADPDPLSRDAGGGPHLGGADERYAREEVQLLGLEPGDAPDTGQGSQAGQPVGVDLDGDAVDDALDAVEHGRPEGRCREGGKDFLLGHLQPLEVSHGHGRGLGLIARGATRGGEARGPDLDGRRVGELDHHLHPPTSSQGGARAEDGTEGQEQAGQASESVDLWPHSRASQGGTDHHGMGGGGKQPNIRAQ